MTPRETNLRPRVDKFVVAFALNVGMLWHTDKGTDFWDCLCPLELGVLAAGQKCRTVPSMFKLALVQKASDCRGKGIRRAGQLLVGMQIKKPRTTAEATVDEKKCGQTGEQMQCYNYWLSMRCYFQNHRQYAIVNRR